MINTVLGTKVKMAQTFVGDERVAVTVVKVLPNTVTQVKSQSQKDGYNSIQIATGSKKVKNTSKSLQGHLKGAIQDNKAPNFLREVRLDSESDMKKGDKVKLTDVLSQGDTVVVTGVSKGKGFAGGVKKWGFSGGPKTHGQSDRHRAPGSIGQGTTPGRVYKGKHMAGRMGNETKTIKNLQVIEINQETNEVMIKGAIPGTVGSFVIIKRLGEMKSPVIEEAPKESQNVSEQENTQVKEEKIEVVEETQKEETNA
ncbi:50S ribosomal protein L3 [Candidatus Microgenomates bacterium]|nr:50S ribosomal protein L3 [Candidatus Microgenomates bacterium]